MLRVATIAAATLGIIMALVSTAGGDALAAKEKPDKQPLPVFIVAPMDGIFWRGTYPGAAPYVEVGQSVEVNTIVAHIEHMRTTRLTAGYEGTVVELLVVDGQMVRAWQPLIKILPNPKPEKPKQE